MAHQVRCLGTQQQGRSHVGQGCRSYSAKATTWCSPCLRHPALLRVICKSNAANRTATATATTQQTDISQLNAEIRQQQQLSKRAAALSKHMLELQESRDRMVTAMNNNVSAEYMQVLSKELADKTAELKEVYDELRASSPGRDMGPIVKDKQTADPAAQGVQQQPPARAPEPAQPKRAELSEVTATQTKPLPVKSAKVEQPAAVSKQESKKDAGDTKKKPKTSFKQIQMQTPVTEKVPQKPVKDDKPSEIQALQSQPVQPQSQQQRAMLSAATVVMPQPQPVQPQTKQDNKQDKELEASLDKLLGKLPAADRNILQEHRHVLLKEKLVTQSAMCGVDPVALKQLGLSWGAVAALKHAYPSPPVSCDVADATQVYLARVAALPLTAQMTQQHVGQLQTGNDPLIKNWKPTAGLLPVAAHPVFGEFLEWYHSSAPPPNSAMMATMHFADMLTRNASDDQDGVIESLRRLLTKYLGYDVIPASTDDTINTPIQGSVTDTAVTTDSSWMAAMLQVNNMLGSSNDSSTTLQVEDGKVNVVTTPEPAYQAAVNYAKFYVHRSKGAWFQHSCCPTFLVEVVSNHIRVSALYFLDRVHIYPLTPLVHLVYEFDDVRHMQHTARVLHALRQSVGKLVNWYMTGQPDTRLWFEGHLPGGLQPLQQPATLLAGLLREPALSHGWTYPLNNFKDIRCIEPGVFIASHPETDQRVLVKVCKTYSPEVHRAWAAAGSAPELYSHEMLPGGWHMSVMEYLHKSDGWVALNKVPEADQPAAKRAAVKELKRLHDLPNEPAYAHGDARPPNVLVRKTMNGHTSWEVKFIDYERAGVAGEKLYPPYMNPDIPWPEGVSYGAALQQHHDVATLENCKD